MIIGYLQYLATIYVAYRLCTFLRYRKFNALFSIEPDCQSTSGRKRATGLRPRGARGEKSDDRRPLPLRVVSGNSPSQEKSLNFQLIKCRVLCIFIEKSNSWPETGTGRERAEPVAVLGKNIWGPGPSSFGRQQRLSEITIEPISGVLPKI